VARLQARPVRNRAPLYTRRHSSPRPAADVRFRPPPHATRCHHSLLPKPRQQGQRPPQPLKHPRRRGPGRGSSRRPLRSRHWPEPLGVLQPLARGWPLSLRRPRGTALNQPGEALEDRGGSPLACRRTELFSVPRQRSGRGPLAGPPPPPQPLPGRPRLVPNALPRAHGGDTEGGAEGSGDAVRLAGNPLRVRLGGRALQAAELWGKRAAAGSAGDQGAHGRLRGVRPTVGRAGGSGACGRRPRRGARAAAAGRKGGSGACGRLRGVRAAAKRAADCRARRRPRGVWAVSGGAGGRGARGRLRGVQAAVRRAGGRCASGHADGGCGAHGRPRGAQEVAGRACGSRGGARGPRNGLPGQRWETWARARAAERNGSH
jgi:hypothetical protein